MDRLASLGWQPHFDDQWKQVDDYETLTPVRITEVRSKGLMVVGGVGTERLIPRSGRQPAGNEDATLVVGDWILLNQDHRHVTDLVLERKSLIKRRAPGRGRKIQLIAANLDTLFVVSSCNQDFNVARMERYIAMALEANVEPVIVLTKRDLCDDDSDGGDDIDTDEEDSESSLSMKWLLDYYVQEASAIAGGTVPVVCLDARGAEPAQQLLAPWIQPGQTVAFLGSSGVGKSTLVNALCGSIVADTGAIHTDSGQGRHTTTRRQLFFLATTTNGSCAVLDTPGLRELQLIDASHGLTQVFGDFVDLAHQCRFNDCQHAGEPGCAIDAAVEEGTIDVDRLARWQKLVAEEALNSNDMAERKSSVQPTTKTTKKNKSKHSTKKKTANSTTSRNKSQKKKRK